MALSFRKLMTFATIGAIAYSASRRLLNSHSFKDEVVVITGGARGLGLELARRWAAEGARVALCSRSAEEVRWAVEELQEGGAIVWGDTCDVTDRTQVRDFIAKVYQQWGRVNVLVNCAGVIQTGP